MCGIAGIVASTRRGAALEDVANAMSQVLQHRGPDDADTWTDPAAGVSLVHRRLSIIDLSAFGRQPMRSADGRYVTTYNGEIYNYREVRRELECEGVTAWRGQSDTEVLLAAISAWGLERALQRITGMYALAVWDTRERVLHLARDRLGEKPLYYGWAGPRFVFASELKAFRAIDGFQRRIDRRAVALYARYAYIPAPLSIYEGVSKLVPGTWLSVRQADVDATRVPLPRTYWALTNVLQNRQHFRGSEDDATTELDSVLRKAVAGQMAADVPLGAFLSGGIDSSCIVAMMQAASNDRVRTFTIGFRQEQYDEAKRAKAIARHLGTDHTELYIDPRDAMALVPRMPEIYDEPFADSSQIPTFLVCQLARRHVTVSLSGDGGDELFAGYNRYRWARAVSRLPTIARMTARSLLTAASPEKWDRAFALAGRFLPGVMGSAPYAGDKVYKFARLLNTRSDGDLYDCLTSFWDPNPVLNVGPDAVSAVHRPIVALSGSELMMYRDTAGYLPDDILVKLDRAAMAVSLETRVPMLDHKVVEFVWRLPLSMRMRGSRSKWLLRRVLARYVPPVLTAGPKMGFSIPLGHWLQGELRDWAESLLSEDRLRQDGYFDAGMVRKHWHEHLTKKRNWQHLIWIVLMFGAWLEQNGRA